MRLVDRLNCPVCQSTGREQFRLPLSEPPLSDYFRSFYPPQTLELLRRLEGEHYVLARCESGECGCWYQQRVPSDALLPLFYASLLSTQESAGIVDPYLQEQRIRELMMVVRFLQPRVPGPALLDFGSGDGSWSKLCKGAGYNVSACDVTDVQASELRGMGIGFHLPNELPSNAYDFINTEQVFEHLTNPAAVLAGLVRALRPGGVLKIGVPSTVGLEEKLSHPDWRAAKSSPNSLNAVAPLEHLNAFTSSGLRTLGARAGLASLFVDGWTLKLGSPLDRPPWRSRLKQYLLAKLHADYQPPYRLAQTAFFLKPNTACPP